MYAFKKSYGITVTTTITTSYPPIQKTIRNVKHPKIIRNMEHHNVNLNNNPHINPKVNPNVNHKFNPDVEPKIKPIMIPNVIPSVNPNVCPNVKPFFNPKITPNVIPNVNPNDSTMVNHNFNPNVDPNVHPNGDPRKNERCIGCRIFKDVSISEVRHGFTLQFASTKLFNEGVLAKFKHLIISKIVHEYINFNVF